MLASLTPDCPVTLVHLVTVPAKAKKTKREKPITCILLRTSAERVFQKGSISLSHIPPNFFPVFYAKPEVRQDFLSKRGLRLLDQPQMELIVDNSLNCEWPLYDILSVHFLDPFIRTSPWLQPSITLSLFVACLLGGRHPPTAKSTRTATPEKKAGK